MKKSLTREILAHLVTCGSKLMLSSLFVPYGQSLGQSLREAEEIAASCPHDFSRHSKNTISTTLSVMKRQKLISARGPKKKTVWRLTQKGKNHFKNLESGFNLPPKDGKLRLFIFDIPENRRQERNWLRTELVSCDYSPLQKSVYMGARPLPAKLLRDLNKRGLFSYVKIVGLDDISD